MTNRWFGDYHQRENMVELGSSGENEISRRRFMGGALALIVAGAGISSKAASAASPEGEASNDRAGTLSPGDGEGPHFSDSSELRPTIVKTLRQVVALDAFVPGHNRKEARITVKLTEPDLTMRLVIRRDGVSELAEVDDRSQTKSRVVITSNAAHEILLGKSSIAKVLAGQKELTVTGDPLELATLQLVPMFVGDRYREALAAAGHHELLEEDR